MSTAAMMERIAETSPRLKARITGVFYLLTILTGIFAQGFVSGRLVVDGDAAATATNILAHRGLFQLGFAVYLIEMACKIAMTALFYDLLKPAGRSVSLVAAFLGLAGCVIKTFSRVFFIAPLFVLGGAHYLSVFSAEQLQALALLFLKVNDRGAAIALVFFGFYALLTGYLIIRSTFLPRILGVLSVVARFGLAELPVSAARIPSVSLHCSFRPPRGSIANPVAPGVRRERTTMEGAGQRSSGNEAHTNPTRRISNETQHHVNHRVSALDPLADASHYGRHRPWDIEGRDLKHCVGSSSWSCCTGRSCSPNGDRGTSSCCSSGCSRQACPSST